MNLYELIAFFSLIMMMAIIFLKLYNLLNNGRVLSLPLIFLSGIGFFLFYALAFMLLLTSGEINFFTIQLFRFQTWLVLFNIIFLVTELIFFFRDNPLIKGVTSYKSIKR
jgi:hypothetical protein